MYNSKQIVKRSEIEKNYKLVENSRNITTI